MYPCSTCVELCFIAGYICENGLRRPVQATKGAAALAFWLLLGFLITPVLISTAYAGTTTDLTVADGPTVCPGTLGGTWLAGNNCEITGTYTINSGDTLIIDTGVALYVASGATVNVAGTLEIDQLVVIFGGGTLHVLGGGIINNYNGIDVYGTLNNDGTINNNNGSIYIGLYEGSSGVLNNFGVINQVSVEGFAEITITGGGILNNECGGLINNPSPGVIEGSVTTIACSGVPEFSGTGIAWLSMIAAIFVPLLLFKRKLIHAPV